MSLVQSLPGMLAQLSARVPQQPCDLRPAGVVTANERIWMNVRRPHLAAASRDMYHAEGDPVVHTVRVPRFCELKLHADGILS